MRLTHALVAKHNRVWNHHGDAIRLVKARTQRDLLISPARHVLRPTANELGNEIMSAVAAGIPTIVVHTAKTWADRLDRAPSKPGTAKRRLCVR